jgi:hypothetical protein
MTGSRPTSILASSAWFALGVAAAFTALSAVDVYLLGHAEHAKGPNTTFVIFVWLAPLVALVAAIAYAIGAKVWRNAPGRGFAVPAGIAIAVLEGLLISGSAILPGRIIIGLVWLVHLGGSFFAARVARAWLKPGGH